MSARFEGHEVRRALGLAASPGRIHFDSVSTDTRQLRKGALFVALRGERFDGHEFLSRAATKGALGAVVEESVVLPDLDFEWFVVPDTARALGDLARYYRRRCAARVIGVTGSSGKTTVKEMLASVLGAERPTHATSGNLNNHIGVPLTILDAPPATEFWWRVAGGLDDGAGGRFIQRVPIPAVEDSQIVTKSGYDCPLARDCSFVYAMERGLGQIAYYVAGRDVLDDTPLISLSGHLGKLKNGVFSELTTQTLYYDVLKLPWDMQKTTMGYLESVDRLTGSDLKQEFLNLFDENGDAVECAVLLYAYREADAGRHARVAIGFPGQDLANV